MYFSQRKPIILLVIWLRKQLYDISTYFILIKKLCGKIDPPNGFVDEERSEEILLDKILPFSQYGQWLEVKLSWVTQQNIIRSNCLLFFIYKLEVDSIRDVGEFQCYLCSIMGGKFAVVY